MVVADEFELPQIGPHLVLELRPGGAGSAEPR